MLLQTFIVDFFKTTGGLCPTTDFLDSLSEKMRAKVLRTIMLLEQNGNNLREPYSKPLGDGIFELRVQHASDISRVLYFFTIGNNIILTHGFVKKTQKNTESRNCTCKKIPCRLSSKKGVA